MRAVISILILAILLIVAAVATGLVNIRRIRGAPPEIVVTRNSVGAKGGAAPAFDVETGSVKVGTKATTVKTPTLEIEKAGQNEAATNNGM